MLSTIKAVLKELSQENKAFEQSIQELGRTVETAVLIHAPYVELK